MYSHHPPDVVTLSRSPSGIRTPETDSPLSSTPNSPRSSSAARDGGSLYEAAAGLLEELVRANKDEMNNAVAAAAEDERTTSPIPLACVSFDENVPLPMSRPVVDKNYDYDDDDDEEEPARLPLTRTEGPFDERLPLDEKKEAETGDGLMMDVQPKSINTSRSSSVYTDSSDRKSFDKDGDSDFDDESQPPSLTVNRSSLEEEEENKEDDDIPDPEETADWKKYSTFMTPSTRRTEPEDPEEEIATERLCSSKGDMSYDEGPLKMTMNSSALMTPIQHLKSPPKVLKQSMAWDTPKLQAKEPSDQKNNVIVSPSPATNNPWLQDEEEENPLDETEDTETPSTLRPMVSPDGKVEYRGEERGKIVDPPSPLETRRVASPMTTQEERYHSFDEDLLKAMVGPSRPQAAGKVQVDKPEVDELVGVEKPYSLTSRSLSEPATALDLASANALEDFSTTFTDAVDLAASVAAAFIGDLANTASCDFAEASESLNMHAIHVFNADRGLPSVPSKPESVSDMPRGLSDPGASNNWSKYLQNQNVSTKSNLDVNQWLGNNKTEHGKIT